MHVGDERGKWGFLRKQIHKRAVPDLTTRVVGGEKTKVHAGRFWKKNKHIYKNSKGLRVKLYGCGKALGAEECIFDRKETLFICCYEQKCKSVSVTLGKKSYLYQQQFVI